jgi:hypothetical protein
MDQHFLKSAFREKLIEHLLIGELLKISWARGDCSLEVAKPEVDNQGYDVLAEDKTESLKLKLRKKLIAQGLLLRASLPPRAKVDALHIAMAAIGGMDYLLTWNCAHIANPAFRSRIEAVIRSFGYEPPIICTPLELLEI